MDLKNSFQNNTRLYLLMGFLGVIMALYLGVLYDTQVNNYDYYLARSIRTITRDEKVEASRGIITDRNGQVLVSNRSTYNLTFDTSLLKSGEDPNEAVLRLLQLCQSRSVSWVDNLPISQTAPFSYTLDTVSSEQRSLFLNYLRSLDAVTDPLGAYLLEHPSLVRVPDEEETGEDPVREVLADETLSDAQKADALVELLPAPQLTTQLLEGAGVDADTLLKIMREKMEVPASFSANETRLVLGVRYELTLRKLDISRDAYILAEDISTEFISLLSDGGFSGAKVTSSSVREYQTSYAAHILGTVGPLYATDLENPLYADYPGDATIGKSGVEAAFEEYLHGTNGRRVVSTNEEGKITGEYYSVEPQPGSTVELTIDMPFQQAVEDALAQTVSQMTAKDGNHSRGAGAAVVKVGTGEILALASYPTYDLSTFRQPEVNAALSADPGKPFTNRATSGLYPPGSTLKPLTAVAALETGNTTLSEKIKDTGRWIYPGTHEGFWCWDRGGHGKLNIVDAITNSCNYFFAEMGYRLGMDTLREYLTAFGLGAKTGIETGEAAGRLPENPKNEDQAPQAAFGQSNQLYTPLQLANYIATLVSGGQHCEAHLLKSVKAYDTAQVLAVGNTTPQNIVEFSDSTLQAVKKGMLGYTGLSLLQRLCGHCRRQDRHCPAGRRHHQQRCIRLLRPL